MTLAHTVTSHRRSRQIVPRVHRGRAPQQMRGFDHYEVIFAPHATRCTSFGDTPCFPPRTQGSFPTRTRKGSSARQCFPRTPPLRLIFSPTTHIRLSVDSPVETVTLCSSTIRVPSFSARSAWASLSAPPVTFSHTSDTTTPHCHLARGRSLNGVCQRRDGTTEERERRFITSMAHIDVAHSACRIHHCFQTAPPGDENLETFVLSSLYPIQPEPEP